MITIMVSLEYISDTVYRKYLSESLFLFQYYFGSSQFLGFYAGHTAWLVYVRVEFYVYSSLLELRPAPPFAFEQ